MRIKVTNKNLDIFDREFSVLNMNYDSILINNNGEKTLLSSVDVELIPESTLESVITNYKDIIKIKLNKGINLNFYSVIIKFIEDKVGKKAMSIDVLEDQFEFIKKGIWEKKIFIIVNESVPLKVYVNGTKFGMTFNVTIRDINLHEFIDECLFSIDETDKKIKEQQIHINIYKRALKNALNNSVLNKENTLLLSN